MGGGSTPSSTGTGGTINYSPEWTKWFESAGPIMGTYLLQKALDPSRRAEYDLMSGMRQQALSESAGANKRLSGMLATQGVQPGSGLAASTARGLETTLMGTMAGIKERARQGYEASQQGWLGQALQSLKTPPHMGNYQYQTQSGGGGGK